MSRAQASTPARIPGLDGIRALAFLTVLLGHCGFTWIPNGFGVTVFFFLSGYLITTLLRREWIQTGDISISHFYIRRALRILPPLYFGIAFSAVLALGGLTHSAVHWKAIAVVLFFLTNYSDYLVGATLTAGLTVLWSLAVEEHYYLVFPLLYRYFCKLGLRSSRQVFVLALACLAALLWRIVLMTHFHVFWYRVYTGTDTRVDSILFGAILAIGANPVIDNLGAFTRRQLGFAAWAGAAIVLATIGARGEMFRQTFRYTIEGLALFPGFLYVIRYRDSVVTRLLENRFLTHIGDLSYSLYVVHYTVLSATPGWARQSPIMALIFSFGASYLVALAVRRWVEEPSHRLRQRLLLRSPGVQRFGLDVSSRLPTAE